MEQNLLKQLALNNFLGEQYFEEEGEFYLGNKEKEKKKWRRNVNGTLSTNFSEYCEEGLDKVDEYDEHNNDYLVLTDEEADKLWDERLQNYIDDVILEEIPKHYRNYFDEEKWKNDAKYDGRGNSIAYYDGEEHKETIEVEGEMHTFYIYRIN